MPNAPNTNATATSHNIATLRPSRNKEKKPNERKEAYGSLLGG